MIFENFSLLFFLFFLLSSFTRHSRDVFAGWRPIWFCLRMWSAREGKFGSTDSLCMRLRYRSDIFFVFFFLSHFSFFVFLWTDCKSKGECENECWVSLKWTAGYCFQRGKTWETFLSSFVIFTHFTSAVIRFDSTAKPFTHQSKHRQSTSQRILINQQT